MTWLMATLLGLSPLSAQTRAGGAAIETVGHAMGDPDAPVAVVEYADFACSACAEFALETWPRVRRELVESGRVHWRLVPFSLGFRHGRRAARAAECAARQDGFWAMHDALFAGQGRWMRPRRPEDTFEEMAEALGLESAALRRCIDDDGPQDHLNRAQTEAEEAGVRATPTFLVNGRPVLGALPFDMFVQTVEAAEEKSGPARRR
jgi:protein-disulfide isomerase